MIILLYFGLAMGIAVLLLSRGVGRGYSERQNRVEIVLVGGTALVVWAAASYYMFWITFGRAVGTAHLRQAPESMFPEGWLAYADLALYAGVGVALLMIVGRVPGRQRPSGR
jgi:hypothetical protein